MLFKVVDALLSEFKMHIFPLFRRIHHLMGQLLFSVFKLLVVVLYRFQNLLDHFWFHLHKVLGWNFDERLHHHVQIGFF